MREYVHIVKGLDPVADAFSGTVYSDIINMENWGHIQFLIYKGVGATGTSTITVEASDDAAGSHVSAIPFKYQVSTTGDTFGDPTAAAATGFATTAGSSQLYKIDVDADALNASGYGYIRLKAVEVVDSAVLGGIIAILSQGKYKDAVPETAIV
jgi:hypothetical protein